MCMCVASDADVAFEARDDVWARAWAATPRDNASLYALRAHRSKVAASIKHDLNIWLERIAVEANDAAEHHDWASLFRILKLLRDGHDQHHCMMYAADGTTVLTEPADIESRWREHWMELFRATSPTYGELEQRNYALEPNRSARLPDPPCRQVADII